MEPPPVPEQIPPSVADQALQPAIEPNALAPGSSHPAGPPVLSLDAKAGNMPLPRTKVPTGAVLAAAVLIVTIIGIAGFLAFFWVQLNEANDVITNQQDTINEQEDLIKEQQELVDRKETFNSAMQELVDTAGKFNGIPMASVVPIDEYQSYATDAWIHRWDADDIDEDTENVQFATSDLENLLADAAAEASSNATGTTYETTIDSLGRGFVASYIDDADTLCGSDVLACVFNNDPYVVHFDKSDLTVAYMTSWLQQGIAYHEFAHVLQFTNPEPTDIALESFGGDHETMADCYALTYLDGWTLDHRIYQGRGWWDVSIGYGYTCNETQRQAIRDWHNAVGFEMTAISQ